MRNNHIKAIALGGLLAAAALVVMCLGGLIPVATYVCPMICCIAGYFVQRFCGRRIGWTWYAAVALLCLLLAPDKESAIVYTAVGSYSLLKGLFDRFKIGWLMKLLYFNAVIAAAYSVMIFLIGMDHLVQENMELGIAGLVLLLVLGNITFFLLDRALTLLSSKSGNGPK